MSVIIRLQNLPWTATALDIRRFFHGLSIPDGGVHIVGGEKGDAFIAFSTDEDARQAMMNDGGKVNNSTIKLFLSSKSEMQSVISAARAPAQAVLTNRDPFGNRSVPSRGAEPEGTAQSPPGYGQGREYHVGSSQEQRDNRAPPPTRSQGQYSNSGPRDARSRSASPDSWDSRETVEHRGRPQFRKGSPSRSRAQGSEDYDRNESPERSVFVRKTSSGNQRYDREESPRHNYRNERSSQSAHVAETSRSYSKEPRGSDYGRTGPPSKDDRESGRPTAYGRNGGPPSHARSGPSSSYRDGSSYRDDFRGQDGPPRAKNREDSPEGRDKYRRDSRERSQSREARSSGHRGRGVYMYIHNMPHSVSYKEVRRFFSGCEIPRDGLKLINDRDGKRNGTGYIKFATEAGCEEAFRLNGEFMGNNPVKLARCSAEEFDMALDSYIPKSNEGGGSPRYSRHYQDYPQKRPRSYSPSPRRNSPPRKRAYSPPFVPQGYCVILENLPVKVEREEIRQFFDGLQLARGGVYVEYDRDGRTMGNGYTEFLTERDRQEALRQHKQILNGSALEIYAISKEEMLSRMNHHRAAQKSLPKLRERRDSSPFEDDHYRDHGPPGPPKRVLLRTPDGPPLRGPHGPPPHGPPYQHGPPGPPRPQFHPDGERKYYVVRLRGLPYDVTEVDVKNFFDGLAIAAQGIHIIYKADGRCNGVGFVQFVTSTDCEEACTYSMHYMGKRYIKVQPTTKKDMYAELNEPPENDGPPIMNKGRGSAVFKGIPDVGDEACVVGCRNVPYRATIREILNFFEDFHPDEDSVRLHYDDTGKPTGDAVIAFHDVDDAHRAVEELNQATLYGRNISLHLL